MNGLTVKESAQNSLKSMSLPVVAAFAAIYIVWGSTYLAIRITVAEIPPLLAAGVRFTIAGLLVFTWARLNGRPKPTATEWRNTAIVGASMFLVTYGLLFWAEVSVPSGITSVLVAAIPIWTTVLEVFFSGPRPGWKRLCAMLIGVVGVAVISLDPSTMRTGVLPCLAILVSGIAWSIGSILAKRLKLPESKAITSGMEMITGGLMLLLSSFLFREAPPFPHPSGRAVAALIYLIVAGSILAFTCYVFLLARMPASSVSSYAYVNPLVALCLGSWLGEERFSLLTLLGAGLVVASVLSILTFETGPSKESHS